MKFPKTHRFVVLVLLALAGTAAAQVFQTGIVSIEPLPVTPYVANQYVVSPLSGSLATRSSSTFSTDFSFSASRVPSFEFVSELSSILPGYQDLAAPSFGQVPTITGGGLTLIQNFNFGPSGGERASPRAYDNGLYRPLPRYDTDPYYGYRRGYGTGHPLFSPLPSGGSWNGGRYDPYHGNRYGRSSSVIVVIGGTSGSPYGTRHSWQRQRDRPRQDRRRSMWR